MSEKIRLLFVDDEDEFVKYMTKRLTRHEIEVHAYTNPVQALEETAGQSYDVGLLDLKMPKMDGEELLNRLKERDPTIEIIILTGHGSIQIGLPFGTGRGLRVPAQALRVRRLGRRHQQGLCQACQGPERGTGQAGE